MLAFITFEDVLNKIIWFGKTYGLKIVGTILIVLVGWTLSKILVRILRKGLSKTKLDISLINFLLRAIHIVILVVVLIAALSNLGISTTGIIAAFSAAAVAISLALKDSLSNIAGGILMLLTQPFSTGHYIETDGVSGTVLKIDMIHTTLKTPDNRQIVIPNGQLVNKTIIDYSKEATRRMDLKFSISYNDDPEKAKAIIIEATRAHELSMLDPEPFVRVTEHADSGVIITLRVWCKAENFWTLHFDLLEKVREDFDKNGITIPYNQLDVHVIENKK
jgi:small conductance mechanosensitive channel